jgi:hypothetical protein
LINEHPTKPKNAKKVGLFNPRSISKIHKLDVWDFDWIFRELLDEIKLSCLTIANQRQAHQTGREFQEPWR